MEENKLSRDAKGHHKCNKCELEFNTRRELHQYKVDVHYGNEIYTCICGKEFHSKRSLGTHKQRCSEVLKQNGQLLDKYVCSGCGREFDSKASLQTHIGHCEQYEKVPSKGIHSSKYWNEEKQMYVCECDREFENHQSLNAHFCFCLKHKHELGLPEKITESKIRSGSKCNFSKDFLGEDGVKKLHAKAEQTIENNIKNGKHYRFNFDGRIKQGWYKGFYCDSSYELVFLIYCLEHDIPIKECKQVFKYQYQGKEHRYYPDFEINGIIYEIKGYECEKSKLKHKLFPQIKMLYYKDLKKCFDYVIQKYGKNFTNLYGK